MLITSETKIILFQEKKYRNTSILIALLLLILCLEAVKDSFKLGDFHGYIIVGDLVLSQENIYSFFGNTWPPFFSVFGVIIALANKLLGYFGIRLLWEIGSLLSCYWGILLLYRMLLGRNIHFFKHGLNKIPFQEPLVIIPLLIVFRFILDNLANIQINTYLFFSSVLIVHLFFQKRYILMGLLLAFTISLKVLPIFFLFYFIFKRKFVPALWTVLFLIGINLISLFVFGFEQGITYYKEWLTEVAPLGYMANHKNQSVFGAILRFLTLEDPTHGLYVNIMELSSDTAKRITYGLIGIVAIIAALLFKKPITEDRKFETLFEFAFIFNAIPLLSPLSWKAYFIFLWPSYILLYILLYRMNSSINGKQLKLYKFFYWLSVLLCVGSSEIFLGKQLFRVLEAWSVVTFGSATLLVLQLFIAKNLSKFSKTINVIQLHPKAKRKID